MGFDSQHRRLLYAHEQGGGGGMSTLERNQKLEDVFRVIFDHPDGSDVRDFRRYEDSRWDSLRSVTLVMALESEFGIRVAAHEREKLTSYGDVFYLVQEKTPRTLP